MADISVLLEGSTAPVYAADTIEPMAIWVTIGVVIGLALVAVIFLLFDREDFGKFAKIALIGSVIYAAAFGILMLVLEITKHFSLVYADENYINHADLISHVLVPLAIACAIVLVSAILLCIIYKFKRKAFKIVGWICGVLILASFVVASILIGMYYAANISHDGYYNSDTASVSNLGLYISMGALIVLLAIFAIFLGKGGKKGFDTKTIAYGAICIALSFALSYIKIFQLPQGGSVTLVSLLPLMVYSYMFGIRKGIFAGIIYGLLQAVQDPFIIHPAQFLLDYPIAFAFIGLAGIFASIKAMDKVPQVKFALGAIVACSFRFVTHVLSGVFAFAAYAGEMNALVYSLSYNSFVFVDMLITIVAGVLVFSSKNFVKLVSQYYKSTRA